MSIQPKPVRLVNYPKTPAMEGVVAAIAVSTDVMRGRVEQAYQHLVTSQGLSPDKAKEVLGI